MERLESLYIADGNEKLFTCYGKHFGSSSKNSIDHMTLKFPPQYILQRSKKY